MYRVAGYCIACIFSALKYIFHMLAFTHTNIFCTIINAHGHIHSACAVTNQQESVRGVLVCSTSIRSQAGNILQIRCETVINTLLCGIFFFFFFAFYLWNTLLFHLLSSETGMTIPVTETTPANPTTSFTTKGNELHCHSIRVLYI